MNHTKEVPSGSILRNRNFLLIWNVGTLSTIGEMAEMLVMGWLVLQITGSPMQVAIVGASKTSTMFGFALVAGAMGDRWNRRYIMIGAQLLNITIVLALLIVLGTGEIQPWHIFVAAAVRGVSQRFDNASRRALMFQIAGAKRLVRALSLDVVGFSTSRIIGPLAVGALLQINGDPSSSFVLLIGVYFLALISAVYIQDNIDSINTAVLPVIESVFQGIKYSYRSTSIMGVLLTTIVVNAVFQYHLFIPVIAQDYLKVGPALMGLLAAGDGMGVILGAMTLSLLGNKLTNYGKVFLTGSLGAAIFLVAFAFSPWYALSFGLLILVGISMACFATFQSGIMLTAANPSFHSRVLGIQGLAAGVGQMGSIEIGLLASALGIHLAIAINSGIGFILIALIGISTPALWRPIKGFSNEDPEDK